MGFNDGSNSRSSDYPSETSPLISRTTIEAVTPSNGIGPEAPLSNGTFETSRDPFTQGKTPTVDESALERQESQDTIKTRQKQYEGLPEVKKNLKYIFPAVAIGIFLSAADQTIIVSSYGKIGSELNALSSTSWIATAYFLTLTSFQPLYGKLSDIFGRKPCLLFGYTIFGLGCLGCGLAKDITQLVAARAFAGIGGGAMTTVVSIVMSDICTLRERGQWQGYINIIYAAGAGAGAPLGGVAADYIGWRWAFLAQVPMCAMAFIAVACALNLPQREASQSIEWRKKLRRIDFFGAATIIAAVFTLLLGFDAGSNDSWTSPIAIGSLVGSLSLWILFLVVEKKVAIEPIAPGRIIFNRTMVACYACNFFSQAGWLSTLFYVPLYFQAIDHITATGAGIRLLPSVLFSVSGSLFAGYYMRRTGKFYWLTVIAYAGLVLGLIGIFLSSSAVINSSVGIIVGMCIGGFGNGNGITTTLIGLIANASHEDQAVATACSYLFRSLGSTFGVAMSATVANYVLREDLSSRLPALGLPEDQAVEIAERVRESLAYLKHLDPKIREVVVQCFAKSTNAAFGLQVILVFGAAVATWGIREEALSK
ncbi:Vacuolar membrane amino acid uptake transporter fnx2 [Pseudocercospora fuligena]|uniref:Vacuolar membrane amino acid uptake transporter fnx2 n=1 Tax=Pseudocercospora fuligena TaxID=685502 RepID=A0A8H6RVK7_9PEZI|nr:Vacuolar membrane amino acid uptake transporter fnx2 [Pseudocercospora fuligena]